MQFNQYTQLLAAGSDTPQALSGTLHQKLAKSGSSCEHTPCVPSTGAPPFKAVNRYMPLRAVNRYTELLDRVQRKDREKKKQPGGEEGLVQGLSREAWLLMDTCNAQLLDPVFAGDAVQFAVLQV